jgi:CheY-like chemotaxis protein
VNQTSDNVAKGGMPDTARRILVVDDHLDSQEVLALFLKCCGHQVRTAADGGEALNLARSFRPHIVFLDLWLPDLDGFAICARLREGAETRRAVIFALTAAYVESPRRVREGAWFDGHLMKPVELAAIGELVSRVSAQH